MNKLVLTTVMLGVVLLLVGGVIATATTVKDSNVATKILSRVSNAATNVKEKVITNFPATSAGGGGHSAPPNLEKQVIRGRTFLMNEGERAQIGLIEEEFIKLDFSLEQVNKRANNVRIKLALHRVDGTIKTKTLVIGPEDIAIDIGGIGIEVLKVGETQALIVIPDYPTTY